MKRSVIVVTLVAVVTIGILSAKYKLMERAGFIRSSVNIDNRSSAEFSIFYFHMNVDYQKSGRMVDTVKIYDHFEGRKEVSLGSYYGEQGFVLMHKGRSYPLKCGYFKTRSFDQLLVDIHVKDTLNSLFLAETVQINGETYHSEQIIHLP